MNEHAEIVIVLDRSGSMGCIKSDMEGGLNEFIDKQKKEPGECSVTLTQFDDKYEVVFSGMPLCDVPKIEIVPRNCTALLDAVGRTVHAVVKRHSDTPEEKRPKRTLCVIITDGQENASQEFKLADVKALIEDQRAKGWEFVYFGANQDAFAEGGRMGIVQNFHFHADAKGTEQVSEQMTSGTTSYRRGGGYN
jgi:uncharacterized protein YegL